MTPESVPDATGTSTVEVFPQKISVALMLEMIVDSQEMKDSFTGINLLADVLDVLVNELYMPIESINGKTHEELQKELQAEV